MSQKSKKTKTEIAEKNQEQRLYVDRIMAESDVKKSLFPFIDVTGQTDAPGHLP